MGRERYNGELEVAGAQVRLTQLDAAAERARRALDTLKKSLRAVYRDPEHALASFLPAAGREPAVAARDLRDTPERFGEMLTPGGRTAARTAAAAGREVIDAER